MSDASKNPSNNRQQRVLGLDQRHAVGLAEAAQAPLQAVPVGVRLHHGPHPGARRAGACAGEVVLHGVEMNGGVQGTWHDG
jgi:hypothetical protein